MNISLSIDSFPVEAELASSLAHLTGNQDTFSELLREQAWTSPETNGFAVLAQTEEGELLGVASAMDISGVGAFEWTVFVHPDHRRLAIGSALADGIHHGFAQRGAEEALAVSVEGDGSAASFLKQLGYAPDFAEVVYGADPADSRELPAGFEWAEGEEGLWELRKEDKLIGALFVEEEGEDLWISGIEAEDEEAMAFILEWSRSEGNRRGKQRVLLDADSEEEGTALFGQAGFSAVSSLVYWEQN